MGTKSLIVRKGKRKSTNNGDQVEVQFKQIRHYSTLSVETFKEKLEQSFSGDIGALSELTEIIKENLQQSLLSDCYEYLTSHQKFTEIMLNESHNFTSLKRGIAQVLSLLLAQNKQMCKKELVPILLSAYGATLSFVDQTILQIITCHELNNCSVSELHPYIWGSAAIEYYSIRKDMKLNIIKLPKLNEVLSLYDRLQFRRTMFQFPVNLSLDTLVLHQERSIVYDPRFVLPSLYCLLSPHNLVDCKYFIDLNGLSLTIAALCNQNEEMRLLGYSILSRFSDHLESSRFYSEGVLWLSIIDLITNSLTPDSNQLSPMLTSFFIRIIDVLTRPTDTLFFSVKEFIVGKKTLTMTGALNFALDLLNTDDNENGNHFRKWSLTFLQQGIVSEDEFKVFYKLNISNVLLLMFHSPLCDAHLKILILKLFRTVLRLEIAVKTLCRDQSFFIWVEDLVLSMNEELKGTIGQDQNFDAKKFETFGIVCAIGKCFNRLTEIGESIYPTFGGEYMVILNTLLKKMVDGVIKNDGILLFMHTINPLLKLMNEEFPLFEASTRILICENNLSNILMLNVQDDEKREDVEKAISSTIIDWPFGGNVLSETIVGKMVNFVLQNCHDNVKIEQWLNKLCSDPSVLDTIAGASGKAVEFLEKRLEV